jgi:hypothetical protein
MSWRPPWTTSLGTVPARLMTVSRTADRRPIFFEHRTVQPHLPLVDLLVDKCAELMELAVASGLRTP